MLPAEESAKVANKDQDHRLRLPEPGQIHPPAGGILHGHIGRGVADADDRRGLRRVVALVLGSHKPPSLLMLVALYSNIPARVTERCVLAGQSGACCKR